MLTVVYTVKLFPQSTHRVAMATFCRTFHHGGKISPAWWGWGCTPPTPPPPTPLYLPSHKKLWCTYIPAEKADTLHLFLLYPYMYSMVTPPPPHPPTFYLSLAVLTVHRILHSQYAQSSHNLHSFQFFKVKTHRAFEICRNTLKILSSQKRGGG